MWIFYLKKKLKNTSLLKAFINPMESYGWMDGWMDLLELQKLRQYSMTL